MKCKLSIVVYNGMACIRTTLETDNNVCLFCEHIGNFTFSLVSPVCSYYCLNHMTSS